MSILDAIRVQRANQKSISDLASLPQNEIIRLAQLGQIPADVVPVVISEKARMAKEMANLRASQQMQQQGGNMPTVIEQAMHANAQAETPQAAMPTQAPMQMPAQGAMPPAMPQGAPQDVGVAALPMGQMFQPQNFESGGIVAFNEGGETSDWQPKELTKAYLNAYRDKATDRDLQVLMAGLGIDTGSIGVNVSKMSDGQREQLAQNLVAKYNAQIGDAEVQGRVNRSFDAPSGVYGLGASASYPVGQGRINAGVNAMRTPENTRVTGYNVGYGGRVGPGYFNAGVNIPKGGRPYAQMNYQMPFEEGGVVGYNGEDGSFVESPTGMRVLRSELPPDQISEEDRLFAQTPSGLRVLRNEMNQEQAKDGIGKKSYSLADALAEIQKANAPYKELTPESQALMEYRKKGILSPGDIEQQKYMRLLQAGLGIMGGTSPYALTNIGTGAQEALKGYAEDIAAQRASKLADLKAAADIAEAKRAEGRAEVGAAAKLYESYLDRQQRADIAKDSQLGAKYAENYVAMRKAMGDSRPVEVIRDEGYTKYLKEAASEDARFERLLATLGSQLNITEKNIGSREAIAGRAVDERREDRELRARRDALSLWGKLEPYDKIIKEYNKIKQNFGEAKAEEFKNKKLEEMVLFLNKRAAAQSRESNPSAPNIPAPRASMGLTPEAIAQLKKNEVTTFGNGQRWTLDNSGNPVQVR